MKWLFSFNGRVSRSELLGRWIAVTFVTGMPVAISAIATSYSVLLWSIPAVIAIPGIVALVSLLVRRLHDRNKSGWWLFPYYLTPLATMLSVVIAANFGVDFGRLQFWVLGCGFLLVWVFTMIGAVEIWMLKGSPGPNRFGDPS
jgi:uncharacterized membrane protein YhaH (DUF805 family)